MQCRLIRLMGRQLYIKCPVVKREYLYKMKRYQINHHYSIESLRAQNQMERNDDVCLTKHL